MKKTIEETLEEMKARHEAYHQFLKDLLPYAVLGVGGIIGGYAIWSAFWPHCIYSFYTPTAICR